MTQATRSPNVAIVGGGVIGLSIAWRAAQQGQRVVLLERGRAVGTGTSWVAAGMLAPISEAARTEQPLLRLGLASAALYPEFVAELADAAGVDPGYLECGTVFAARDRDEAEALERELSIRQDLGLSVRRLLPSEARRLEPGLAPVIRLGLDVPEDHVIEPRRLLDALALAARRAGAEVRTDAEVSGVVVQDGRVCGVRLACGERIAAERIVVAGGVWSSSLAGLPEAARVPLHPIKGQTIRLRDPSGPGLLTRVLRYPSGYVVPRGDGRYLVGATMEERGFDTTVTAGAAFELLRDATELLPGLAELVVEGLHAGLRPATVDNAPAIGPGLLPGLVWAVGHYRGGILLTPVTAAIVAAVLAGEEPPAVAADADPARFASGGTAPAQAAQNHPAVAA